MLGYYENLTEDELPPEELFGHDERLTDWFEQVKIRRSSSDTPSERVPDPSDYAENELAREILGR